MEIGLGGRNHADQAEDCARSRQLCVGDHPGICWRDADRWHQEFQHTDRRPFLLCQRDRSRVRSGRPRDPVYQRGRGGRPGRRAGGFGRDGDRAARKARLRSWLREALAWQIKGVCPLDEDHRAALHGNPHQRRKQVGCGKRCRQGWDGDRCKQTEHHKTRQDRCRAACDGSPASRADANVNHLDIARTALLARHISVIPIRNCGLSLCSSTSLILAISSLISCD